MAKIPGTPDQVLAELRRRLDLMWQDLTFAIACFELFRIAARDQRLLARLGKSYAAGAFRPVRDALFRETVLALMRIWDKRSRGNFRMDEIVDNVVRTEIVNAIKMRRRSAFRETDVQADLAEVQVDNEIARVKAIRRRARMGKLSEAVNALEKHRHRFLAHTEINVVAAPIRAVKYGDERYLLRWSATLSQLLNVLVDDLHVSPRHDFEQLRIAATLFWAPVRAETLQERRTVLDQERLRRETRKALRRRY